VLDDYRNMTGRCDAFVSVGMLEHVGVDNYPVLGDVIDRVLYGYVVDFLDFHWAGMHFPAFNVADTAITVGATCLILDELLRVRRAR
jgi:hypothetical protein